MRAITTFALIPMLLTLACAPSERAENPADTDTAVSPTAPTGAGFDTTLELQGITFHVTCANDSSINTVTIEPAGLEMDNSPIVREVDGSVVGAEVGDLDANGSPEVYVYVTSAGSGSYGSLVAYAANNKKSLSEIYLPPLEDDPEASAGYMGHDEFSLVELRLARRFPVYLEGDTNANPTGGTRVLEYVLEPGEAGWVLQLDNRMDLDVDLPPAH